MHTSDHLASRSGLPTDGTHQRVTYERLPYGLSSIALIIYIFSIIYLANTPEGKLSKYIGFGFAFIFFTEFLITRQRRVLFPREYLSLLAFLWLMLTSTLWSARPELAITHSLTVLQLLVFSVITLNILLARRTIMPVAIGLIIGLSWAIWVALRENSFVLAEPLSYRPGSTLVNANIYAMALSIGAWIAFYVLGQRENQRWKVWPLIIFISMSVHQILFYAGSVKGILAVALAVPLFLSVRYGIVTGFRLDKRVGLAILLFGIYLIGSRLLSQTPYYWRVSELSQRISSNDARVRMLDFALTEWREKPILGYGANQFRGAYGDFAQRFTYSHSNYSELLFNHGLVGFFLYHFFFLAVAIKYWRLYQSSYLSQFQIAWTYVALIELAILSTAAVIYYDKLTWVLVTVMLTIAFLPRTTPRNAGETRNTT